jgi:hypothetical protein
VPTATETIEPFCAQVPLPELLHDATQPGRATDTTSVLRGGWPLLAEPVRVRTGRDHSPGLVRDAAVAVAVPATPDGVGAEPIAYPPVLGTGGAGTPPSMM